MQRKTLSGGAAASALTRVDASVGFSGAEVGHVRRRLAEVLHNSLPDLEHIATHPSLVGGKLLRARLLLACGRAVFGTSLAVATELAVVLELAHLATLLHDDVIDAETVRRHAGTFRADMGNRSSVLAGDFVLTRAVILLSSLNGAGYVDIVAQAVSAVLEGELVQNSQCGNLDLDADHYLHIIRLKTGALFQTACKLAVIGCELTDQRDREQLAEVGMLVGTAYQLCDDYADYFGDFAKLGKPLGRDFSAGTVTLPLIYAISRSSDFRREVARSFGRGSPRAEALQCLVAKMRLLGADEHVRGLVASLLDSARQRIAGLSGRGIDTPVLIEYLDQFATSVNVALLGSLATSPFSGHDRA